MWKIKLIEAKNIKCYANGNFYGNFDNIINHVVHITNMPEKLSSVYLKMELPVCKYFLENKDKYLFIKYMRFPYHITIIDKEFFLSNMYNINIDREIGKGFYRFIKYQLIKEKLYGKI